MHIDLRIGRLTRNTLGCWVCHSVRYSPYVCAQPIAQSGAMLALTKAGVCAIVNTILPSFPPAIELPSTSPAILWEAFSEFGISCHTLTPVGKLLISLDCVFDASLVPETCLEFPSLPVCSRDSIRQAKTVYALDSTTIDLCLALFPWGKFRRHKSAVKLPTLLDLRGSIPANVYVTGGQIHDVNLLDQLLPEAGAFYLLDRGYVDFARLYLFTQACAFFITRARKDLQFYRRYSRAVERSAGLRCDQTILLTGIRTAKCYPAALRRIHYFDAEKDLRLTFLTNNKYLTTIRTPWVKPSKGMR